MKQKTIETDKQADKKHGNIFKNPFGELVLQLILESNFTNNVIYNLSQWVLRPRDGTVFKHGKHYNNMKHGNKFIVYKCFKIGPSTETETYPLIQLIQRESNS